MSKHILINRKTGKEIEASDPDAVMKRFPKQYFKKPATQLNADVKKAEESILSKSNEDIETAIASNTDIEDLQRLLKEEKAGKGRKGAIQAFEKRIASLQEEINNTEVNADEA